MRERRNREGKSLRVQLISSFNDPDKNENGKKVIYIQKLSGGQSDAFVEIVNAVCQFFLTLTLSRT